MGKKEVIAKKPLKRIKKRRGKAVHEPLKRSERLKEKKRLCNDKESEEEQSEDDVVEKKHKRKNAKRVLKREKREEDKGTVPAVKAAKESKVSKQDVKDIEGIADEIKSILDKIQQKKKANENAKSFLKKKRNRSISSKPPIDPQTKQTEKDFNYHLQLNSKEEHQEVIDIKKASHCSNDILLTMFELTLNASYYRIGFKSRSIAFWRETVQYEELKKIFGSISPEKLHSYWKLLCACDIGKVKELISSKESFLNKPNIKLKTIVTALSNFFKGKITDIEEYISNITIEPSQLLAKKMDERAEMKQVRLKSFKPKKTRASSKEDVVEEVHLKRKERSASKKKVKPKEKEEEEEEEEEALKPSEKLKLRKIRSKTKDKDEGDALLKKINKNPFLLDLIDTIAVNMMKQFTKYTKEYITEILVYNSCNIAKAYSMLQDLSEKQGKRYLNDCI